MPAGGANLCPAPTVQAVACEGAAPEHRNAQPAAAATSQPAPPSSPSSVYVASLNGWGQVRRAALRSASAARRPGATCRAAGPALTPTPAARPPAGQLRGQPVPGGPGAGQRLPVTSHGGCQVRRRRALAGCAGPGGGPSGGCAPPGYLPRAPPADSPPQARRRRRRRGRRGHPGHRHQQLQQRGLGRGLRRRWQRQRSPGPGGALGRR